MKFVNHIFRPNLKPVFLPIFVFFSLMFFFASCEKATESKLEIAESKLESYFQSISTDNVGSRTISGCFTVPAGSDCQLIYENKKTDIYIPEYDCYAEVSYDLYSCEEDQSQVSIRRLIMDNLQVTASEDCIGFWNDIANAPTPEAVDALHRAFYQAAVPHIEFKEANSVVQIFNDLASCDEGVIVVTSEFFTSNCYTNCRSQSDPGSPFYSVVQTKCGDGCCSKEQLWCYNSEGKTVRNGPATIQEFGSCNSITSLPAVCPLGYYPITIECNQDPCD